MKYCEWSQICYIIQFTKCVVILNYRVLDKNEKSVFGVILQPLIYGKNIKSKFLIMEAHRLQWSSYYIFFVIFPRF